MEWEAAMPQESTNEPTMVAEPTVEAEPAGPRPTTEANPIYACATGIFNQASVATLLRPIQPKTIDKLDVRNAQNLQESLLVASVQHEPFDLGE